MRSPIYASRVHRRRAAIRAARRMPARAPPTYRPAAAGRPFCRGLPAHPWIGGHGDRKGACHGHHACSRSGPATEQRIHPCALDLGGHVPRRRFDRADGADEPEPRGSAVSRQPEIVLHIPALAFENGEDVLRAYRDAEDRQPGPLILVLEGAVPMSTSAATGTGRDSLSTNFDGRPITVDDRADRLAPTADAVQAIGTCATRGGIPAMRNDQTGVPAACPTASVSRRGWPRPRASAGRRRRGLRHGPGLGAPGSEIAEARDGRSR